MTGRKEWLYLRVFHELIMQTNYSWNPSYVTGDSKHGLVKAIKQEHYFESCVSSATKKIELQKH
ncbi:hypothetical protein HZS_7224 [Henneguya salminicola]|nr:hypothetical protein HZS_7224 [Henneguya salminicola]